MADIYKRVTFSEFENRTETELSSQQELEHNRILEDFLTKFRGQYLSQYSLKTIE